jgi:hypothetical protein
MLAGTGQAPEWKLAKNVNGITLYTASDPAYAVKGVKAELEFDARLPQLIAVVMDVDHYSGWVYQCKQSKLLKRLSKQELIYYHVTDAPWPVDDRDLISKFSIKKNSPNEVEITSGNLDNYMPVQPGFVRVKKTNAYWKFTQQANGKVHAEYRLFLDPGGSVPAWIMNLFITNGPYETFLNMKKQVNDPQYAKARMEDYF